MTSIISSLLTLLSLCNVLATADIIPADASKNISWPYHAFQSTPITAPVVEISGNTTATDPGLLFFAPDGPTAFHAAPLITDTHGDLVWSGPHGHAFGFGAQTYRGDPVLVFWNGTAFGEPVGRGHGTVEIWNASYEPVARVALPGHFVDVQSLADVHSHVDLHEMYLTDQGTMCVLGNNVTRADLSSVGGPVDGWVVEAQVYEIDVATGAVLFEWRSLDHLAELPFALSVYPIGSEGFDGRSRSTAWGYFHINSVMPYGEGGYVLSSRYLSSAIALDRTGKVAWRIQGIDGGDFTLGDGADFRYQHDIRVVESNATSVVLRLHDNHNCPIDNNTVPGSGKFLTVDLATHHVSLRDGLRYSNTTGPIFPTAQGSFQTTSTGTLFHASGWIPVLEEFSPAGVPLATYQVGNATRRPAGGFESRGRATFSYRGSKHAWVGCPRTRPSVVAHAVGDADAPRRTKVFVSWNGATEVVRWEVWGGIDTVSHMVTVPRTGFETVVEVADVRFVRVKPVLSATAPGYCEDLMSELVFVRAPDADAAGLHRCRVDLV